MICGWRDGSGEVNFMIYVLSRTYARLCGVYCIIALLFTSASPIYAADSIFLPMIHSGATHISAASTDASSVLVQLMPGANITQVTIDYQTTILGSIPALGIYRLQVSNSQLVDLLAHDGRVKAAETDDAHLIFEARQESYGIAGNDFEALQRYFGFGSGDGTPNVDIQIDRKGKARYRDDVWVVGRGQTFDPTWTNWGEEKIRLFKALTRATGAGIKVAVLDTGVDLAHPQLVGHLLQGYDFVDNDDWPADVGNGLDDDQDGFIDEGTGHGTHVAGIVSITAPQSQIIPVRVLNSDGGGSLFDIIKGVVFAVDQGAQVLNFSMSAVNDSPLFAAAIRYALDRRVVVIAAANGTTTSLGYPAAYEGVIAVAAIRADGAIANFSLPYANLVDVFAPGELIFSSYINDNFAWWSGTSMAAPFVTGEAALLLGRGAARGTCDSICVKKLIVTKVIGIKPKVGNIGLAQLDIATAAIK